MRTSFGSFIGKTGQALLAIALAALLAACGGSRSPTGNDVVVTGTGPTGSATTGSEVEFQMSVRNSGTNEARDIQIVNQLGGGLTDGSIVCAAAGGATCPTPADFVMRVPSLPVGGELRFTVRATVSALSSGTASNTMSATLADDVDRLSNSAIVTLPVVATSANLVVSGVGPAGTVAGGTSADFVMTVRNDGPDAAQNVRILESVEGNLSLTAITCTATGGATCPTAGLDMRLDSLPAGASLAFTVTAAVPQISGTIANTMAVSADNDRNTDDNRTTATGSAYTAQSGVYVTGSGPAATVAAGSSTSFTMTVGNAGPDAATDVRIINALGAGLSLSSITCSATDATCPAATGPVMTVASLPAAGTLVFTVNAYVPAGFSGAISNTLSATPSNDPNRDDNSAVASGTAAAAPDVQVTQTGAASAAVGSTTGFSAVVTNNGPSTATNLRVDVTTTGGGSVTYACSPAVLCPTTLGPTMTLASLEVGRSVTFTISVPVTSSPSQVINGITVTAAGDPVSTNNTATTTTQGIDAKSGRYLAYAADGREYTLDIDFDAGSYTMTGGSTGAETRSFTADTGGNFVVSGNERLRIASDLVVGNHRFGSTVLPFVAGRRFATSIEQIGGAYNTAIRTVDAAGTNPTTRPGTMRVAGNVLALCEQNVLAAPAQNCDSASLVNHTLSVDGEGLFTATPTTGGSALTFRIARSGASAVLLSTQAVNSGAQLKLRLALPDGSSLAGGTLAGPSTSGEWIAMTLQPQRYDAVGDSSSLTANLQRITSAGPFSMLSGAVASGATVYVMQSAPLAFAIGVPGGTGNLNGMLQIAVP